MGYPQALQIVKAGGVLAVTIQSGTAAQKCGVLAPIRSIEAAGRIPGEILHMELIDHGLRRMGRCLVCIPLLGVGGFQIQDHTALAVDAAGSCIGISGTLGLALYGYIEIVVPAIQVTGSFVGPHTLLSPLHRDGLRSTAAVSLGINMQEHRLCRRCPQIDTGTLRATERAQRLVAMVFLSKCFGSEALNIFHTVTFCL